MAIPGRTARDRGDVDDLLASLDEHTANDARALVAMMRRISGHPPKPWTSGTIGFDAYHFRYDSGREGDCHALGFHPRKGKTTIYLMDGTARHAALLARLGKHTASRVCLYVKRLDDVDVAMLEQICRDSYAYLKSRDGAVPRVVTPGKPGRPRRPSPPTR
jgi:hypothetical protein